MCLAGPVRKAPLPLSEDSGSGRVECNVWCQRPVPTSVLSGRKGKLSAPFQLRTDSGIILAAPGCSALLFFSSKWAERVPLEESGGRTSGSVSSAIATSPCCYFSVLQESKWTIEAFADRDAPRYLIRDRDSNYGNHVCLRIASLGMKKYSPPLGVLGRTPTPNV